MKTKLSLLIIVFSALFVSAQDEDIKKVSDESCSCISEISLNIEKAEANEKIKSCISAAILSNQIKDDLLGQITKSVDVSTSSKENDTIAAENNKDITIIVDKNYDEVEEYLLRNCEKLKILIASDNKKFDNSYSTNKKALKLYDEGVSYFKARNYKKAAPKFKKALKEDKKFGFAWDNLGMCQRQLGDYKEAIKSYNESLNLDPSGRMPLMNIPVVYEYLKDYDKAIKAYKRFSEIYPKDPEGHYGLGRMYHMKEDYNGAVESMFQAYIGYKEIKSPYVQDAEKNISIFYKEMKEKGMLDAFNEIAKKYNVTIN